MGSRLWNPLGAEHLAEFGLRKVGAVYFASQGGFESFVVWADQQGHFFWREDWSLFPAGHPDNNLGLVGSHPASAREIRRRLDGWVENRQRGRGEFPQDDLENLRRRLSGQQLSL